MAIKASTLVQQHSAKIKTQVDELERIIDLEIPRVFQGGKTLSICLDSHYGGSGQWGDEKPPHVKIHEDVLNALKARYHEAGWKAKIEETNDQRDGYTCILHLSIPGEPSG